jgi:hypothetical protein
MSLKRGELCSRAGHAELVHHRDVGNKALALLVGLTEDKNISRTAATRASWWG